MSMIHWISCLLFVVTIAILVLVMRIRRDHRKVITEETTPILTPVEEAPPKRKKVPLQVLLRIIDENGNLHVIRRGPGPGRDNNGWLYVMEGHWGQPESWRKTMPNYYIPITQEELMEEYRKQGKEWTPEEQSWE
jgi:hypothetical protein